MKNRFFARLAVVCSVLLWTVGPSPQLLAQVTNPPAKPIPADTTATPVKKKADKPEKKAVDGSKYPFHGTIASVDKKAMSITLEGKEHQRVVRMNAASLLEKVGKPATLSDLAAGDYLHGRVEKKAGQEYVIKATAGPKPEKKAAPADKPAKKKTTADL